MNEIHGVLGKLSGPRKEVLNKLLSDLMADQLNKYKIDRLKNNDSVFRVQKDGLRALFLKKSGGYFLISVQESYEFDSFGCQCDCEKNVISRK